jgi:hypothetical protein
MSRRAPFALHALAVASLMAFGCDSGGDGDPGGSAGSAGSRPAAGASGATGGSAGTGGSGSGGSGGQAGAGGGAGGGGTAGTGGVIRPPDAGSARADGSPGRVDAGADAAPAGAGGGGSASPGPFGPTPGGTVCINADGPEGQDTYARLESILGDNCIENPDGDHTPPFRHIKEETDAEVGHHFAFYVHQNDSDRGTNNGKNRLEIKVHTAAADALQGTANETVTYSWRFKMDAGMVYSPRFNAMFQLKSFGGNDKLPLINIKVAPNGGSDKLIVEYIGDAGGEVRAIGTAPVTDAKGMWLEVVCRVEYKDAGSVFVTIKRPDGSSVLTVDSKGLDMWRQGSYVRPKWGLYRGISPNTRELEIVRFANFGITPGATPSSDCRAK